HAAILPAPALPQAPLDRVLRERRSTTAFAAAPLTIEEIATISFAAYGVTGRRGLVPSPTRRSTPSGGALYPLELYLVALAVEGLESGLYHYDPLRHVLEALRLESLAGELEAALSAPELSAGCSAVFAVGAV